MPESDEWPPMRIIYFNETRAIEGNLRDEQLKDLLAENLPEYFELLVLAYQHKLKTFVFRFEGQDVEDIVQETFVKAYNALSALSPLGRQALKLRPWLFAIAHNFALTYLKREGRIIPISIDRPEGSELLEETEHGQHPSADKEVEQGESRDELYACIQHLPEHLRLPVVLHYLVGLEYHEIAEILHQPLNTVKSNGRRALARLRKCLEEERE